MCMSGPTELNQALDVVQQHAAGGEEKQQGRSAAAAAVLWRLAGCRCAEQAHLQMLKTYSLLL